MFFSETEPSRAAQAVSKIVTRLENCPAKFSTFGRKTGQKQKLIENIKHIRQTETKNKQNSTPI